MKRLLSLAVIFILLSCEKEKLIKTEQVLRLAADSSSNVWMQSSNGMTRFNGSSWVNFDLPSQGLPFKEIRGFYAKGNDFYILSNIGYLHYNASSSPIAPLEKIDKSSGGIKNDTVLSLLVTDRTWVLTPLGISFYNNSWVKPDASKYYDTLCTDFFISNDTCYVATAGFGVSRYIYTADGITGASSYFQGYGCMINDTVYSILIAKNKVQWYGTAAGVIMHPSSDYRDLWQYFTPSDGLPDLKINKVFQDKSDRIWALSDNGASLFNGNTWTAFLMAGISSYAEDGSGNLWFASPNGLGRYDGSWKIITTADGLSDNKVNCVSASGDGSIWIGTQNGATQYKNGVYTVYRSITQN